MDLVVAVIIGPLATWPVLGPVDDAIVAVLVLRFARRRLGDAGLRARWTGSPAGYELLARLLGGSPGA